MLEYNFESWKMLFQVEIYSPLNLKHMSNFSHRLIVPGFGTLSFSHMGFIAIKVVMMNI